ncbi:probable serine/threonine-protein kinase drkD isoform X2 [Contarinia nasturtii]|uniref:probable serine/threonine-protein kinase drkD isoform X2 n=1 Tax=Contarinia nasturtii TaxID=265458 RepID=UPI0012D3CCD4|nr:probable serine/threonine-protein kinase drkD isoform X2 [Contarinia nasturtii]
MYQSAWLGQLYYTIWTLIWIAWNIFLICFYLNVGGLNRDSDILNLGTGSVSWFEANGPGCIPTYPTNITSEDPYRLVRPESVEGCLLEYQTIEVIHSSFQLFLAIFGLIGSLCLAQVFFDDDDRFDFMGGDAKCVQHKIVMPMYVSIPTMKSTKLLTNPYLDVTTTNSTSAATYNLEKKSINDHNQKSTNNRNTINNINKNNRRCNANSEINTNTNMNATINVNSDNIKTSDHYATNFFSMSYNPYKNGTSNEHACNGIAKKIMTNPVRSHNTDNIKRQYNHNDIVYRNSSKLSSIRPGCRPRSIRYSDSDDTRSSSIDYNFNYVKFRSPLSANCMASNYRDSSTTSTLATECSLFVHPSSKHVDEDEKKQSIVLSKVHNHPNCQCGIQNCCPFANERFDNHLIHHRSHGGTCSIQDRQYFVQRYPYRRRDLNTSNALNYDHKIHESPPEYDQVDDFLMKRTFSHDRLFCQRRLLTARNRTRPKSYCSNVSYCPTQL